MNARIYRSSRVAFGIVAALTVVGLYLLPAAAQPASGKMNLGQLRPGFGLRIPYGKVSTISGSSAVAQHDPAMAHDPNLLRDPRVVKSGSNAASLPPAIQFLSVQRPTNGVVVAPQANAFCNTFLPVNPQPLQVSQTVSIVPATQTAYMALFPIVKYQHDDVDVGHMETCVRVSSNGAVDAKTRVWTGNDFQGFEGGVDVIFSDIDGNRVGYTPEHHWGVNGHSVPGAPSDVTNIWHDQITDNIGSVWAVSIAQLNHPTSHFDDFMAKAMKVAQLAEEVGKAYNEFKGSGSPGAGGGTDPGGVSGGTDPGAGAGGVGPAPKPAGSATATQACVITAMNLATGLATARANVTGQTFQFKVADAALLRTLRVGQNVYANFATGRVGITAEGPCCTIVK